MKPSQSPQTSFAFDPAPSARRRPAARGRANPRARGGSRPGATVESLEGRQLLTVLPGNFTETQITTGFASPTAMAVAPDGRMFVTEQDGQVVVVKNGQLLDTPFTIVDTEAVTERGLGGIELDPNFATNGYVYVYYTANTPVVHNRVSRFTADPNNPDVALAGSETIIFEIDPSGSGYHQGGALHFGPDNKLYVAVGDHGGTTRAQALNDLFGKMLRINPDGTIPTDNPFYNTATGNNRAIWALGLRNPFTFAIQPGTGTMYINDVGQNLWEEINVGAAGANYGWPTHEGASTEAGYTSPLKAFPHPEWKAITGASFYNPQAVQFPPAYIGSYFFGDLDRKWIKRIDPATGNVVDFAAQLRGEPIDIDLAADGSLLYLARPVDVQRPGGVYRISYASTGAPGISTQPQSRTVMSGQSATFSVVASGAEPLAYQWQRDEVNIPGATSATYTLTAGADDDGARFRVVVSNGSGSVTSSAATLTVAAGGAPTATIAAPAPGTPFSAGDTIAYSGTATDAEDGPLGASALTWQVDYVTGQVVRPLVPATTGSASGSFTIPRLTPYTGTDVLYRVTLTATDSDGLTHTTTHDLVPRTANVTVASNVPGLKLRLDGQPMPSPTFAGVAGFERLLTAPAATMVNGVNYEFVSWSDGGAAEHQVFTPAADTTYTANYRALDDGSANPPSSPDLSVAFVQQPAASVVTGTTARTRVRVSNAGPATVGAAATTALYLSTDPFLDPDDVQVAALPRTLRVAPGRSRMVPISFTYPEGTAAGSYHLLAWADAAKAVPERDETNNVAASAAPVAVGPASRDFTATISNVAVRQARVQRGTATLLVRYDGNVPAGGTLGIELRASADAAADAADPVVATIARRVRMKPGTSKILRLRFLPQGLGAGSYHLTATVDAANAFVETDETNNTAISATPVAMG